MRNKIITTHNPAAAVSIASYVGCRRAINVIVVYLHFQQSIFRIAFHSRYLFPHTLFALSGDHHIIGSVYPTRLVRFLSLIPYRLATTMLMSPMKGDLLRNRTVTLNYNTSKSKLLLRWEP